VRLEWVICRVGNMGWNWLALKGALEGRVASRALHRPRAGRSTGIPKRASSLKSFLSWRVALALVATANVTNCHQIMKTETPCKLLHLHPNFRRMEIQKIIAALDMAKINPKRNTHLGSTAK